MVKKKEAIRSVEEIIAGSGHGSMNSSIRGEDSIDSAHAEKSPPKIVDLLKIDARV